MMGASSDDVLLTLDEFERLPDDECRAELFRGRLVRGPPAGMDHGRLANRIAFLLTGFVDRETLGEVFTADTGFVRAGPRHRLRLPGSSPFPGDDTLEGFDVLLGFTVRVAELFAAPARG